MRLRERERERERERKMIERKNGKMQNMHV